MATSRLVQASVLTWIQGRVAADRIVDEPGLATAFPTVDARAMRAVLADLADAGKVSVDWKAEPFTVSLGRKAKGFTPAKPIAASVVRREETGDRVQVHPESVLSNPHAIHRAQVRHRVASEDETAERIKRILERGKSAVAAEPQTCASSQVAAPPATVGEIKRLPTAPGKGMGQGYKPALVATREDRRQLNVHFPSARFGDVERMAQAAGSTPSAWARSIVMAALDGADPVAAFDAGRKPFIRAAVIRAAARDTMPLHDFVTMLIERGFASYEADAALERAA